MYQQTQSHPTFAFNQPQTFNQYKPMPASQFASPGHTMLGEPSQNFSLSHNDATLNKPSVDMTHFPPPQTPYTPAAPPSVATLDPNMPQPQLQYILNFFCKNFYYVTAYIFL